MLSCSKEPPVMVLNQLKASLFDIFEKSSRKYAGLTPGIGRFEPKRMTTSIRKMKRRRFLRSFTVNTFRIV